MQVKSVVNDNRREENECATDALCRAIVECGAAAAEALGVRLAGVDVITTNPDIPLCLSGGAVLEVNTTPGFHYHYVRRDEGVAAAAMVLQRFCGTAWGGA